MKERQAVMKIVLTEFAINAHFKSDRAGTFIDCDPKDFEEQVHIKRMRMSGGYDSFCTLAFFSNWTDARAGTMPITSLNYPNLRSEYKARNDKELPVLVRWLEMPADKVPVAKFLCLVLYSKEQLYKEGTDIGDADYGVVAILGQMHNQEEPMTPATWVRNVLGVEEGGSGIEWSSTHHAGYLHSVEFWDKNAAVKICP